MLSGPEIEIIRRSAAMAPLSKNATAELIDSHLELLHERAQIAAVLAELPSSFGAVRAALNDLQRLVTPM